VREVLLSADDGDLEGDAGVQVAVELGEGVVHTYTWTLDSVPP
jgi:hypothetical protein